MELPYIIGFILIIPVACKIELMNISEEPFDLEFEWQIISKFLADQYTVTLLVEQNYEEFGNKLFKFSINNYRFGVFQYNNITLISQFWESLQNRVIFTNRIYGAIIVVRHQYLIDFAVKASANNKLVLVFFDQDVKIIKKIMQNLWNSHKHLLLITLSIENRNGNRIIQHNPFEAKFFEYPIKNIDSSTNFALHLNSQFTAYLHNMAGYGIRVFIFEFPLVSEFKRNEAGLIINYGGVDGGMLKLSKQFMNYTPIFVAWPTIYSTNLSTLTTTSTVIDEGQAEVGLNARFIVDNPYNNTVYMYPLNKAPLMFVVPINYELAPLVILAYYYFDSMAQLVISLNLLLLIVLWWLGTYIIKENAETATSAIPFRVLGIVHGISVKVPKKLFNQIIFITIAFFGLLLTSVYQGTVVKQLNNPLKPYQLNSLKDLLNSNLNITIFLHPRFYAF